MRFVKRARTALAILALSASACGSSGALANTEQYRPPPPLALVVLVDPSSGSMADQLRQLEDVIRASASPNESVVVMMLQTGSARQYVVRPGDSLSSIAAANGLTLSTVEAVNPQFGPVSGRNWSVIHSGERVTLPDGAARDPLLLATRAPAGPPPPQLMRIPRAPSNPTDYQRAQYSHTVANNNAVNASRVAAWRAEADRAVQPWQSQVVGQLEKKTGTQILVTSSSGGPALSTSIGVGLTTLSGLSGRRTLLLLGGGDSSATLAPRSLVDVTLVIANVSDPQAVAAWKSAGVAAGAPSVNALDPALTQLQLAQIVNQ